MKPQPYCSFSSEDTYVATTSFSFRLLFPRHLRLPSIHDKSQRSATDQTYRQAEKSPRRTKDQAIGAHPHPGFPCPPRGIRESQNGQHRSNQIKISTVWGRLSHANLDICPSPSRGAPISIVIALKYFIYPAEPGVLAGFSQYFIVARVVGICHMPPLTQAPPHPFLVMNTRCLAPAWTCERQS